MTAEDKIGEAEYNFQNLTQKDPMSKEFGYEMSNFLSSSQSIAYHLLEEYNVKYGLNLQQIDARHFREKALAINHPDAIAFIKWYDNEFSQIATDTTYGHLTTKRHVNIHKSDVAPKWFSGIGLIRNAGTDEAKLIDYQTIVSFEENLGQHDARQVCRQFLDRLKKFVNDAHSQFPI